MIRIRSKQNNFRRCGMAHPDKAVEYPSDRFTSEQLAVLKAEPMLVVEIIPDDQAGSGTAAEEDISAMTVEQLKTAISAYQPIDVLKGIKKAELIEILKAHLTGSVAPRE